MDYRSEAWRGDSAGVKEGPGHSFELEMASERRRRDENIKNEGERKVDGGMAVGAGVKKYREGAITSEDAS